MPTPLTELSELEIKEQFEQETRKIKLGNDNVKEEETEGEEDEEEVECSICYETTQDKENPGNDMTELSCGHVYHKTCLLKWMEGIPSRGELFHSNHAKCPLCRKFIEVKKKEEEREQEEPDENISIEKPLHIKYLFFEPEDDDDEEGEEENEEPLNIKSLMKGLFIDLYGEEEDDEEEEEKEDIYDEEEKEINRKGEFVRSRWESMCQILLSNDCELFNQSDEDDTSKKDSEEMIKYVMSDRIVKKRKQKIKKQKIMKEFEDRLRNFEFYVCYECGKLYFGGMKDCAVGLAADREEKNEEDKKDRICSECVVKRSNNSEHKANCEKHGTTFIVFKCRYCCRIANWFCFGTTHFCHRCHTELQSKVYECPGPPECTGHHKKNGKQKESEQCLGCLICRYGMNEEDTGKIK